jgi:hypothetical protein
MGLNVKRPVASTVYRVCSEARTVTRFLDGAPLLLHTICDGFVPSGSMPLHHRVLITLRRTADVFFYPLEHIAFLTDLRVLRFPMGSMPWWYLSCVLWGISLLCSMALLIEQLVRAGGGTEDLLALARQAADFALAVFYMPPGILWAAKLSQSSVAVFGLVSCLLGMRSIVTAHRAAHKKR